MEDVHDAFDSLFVEFVELKDNYEILKGALEDILTADETSTAAGAVAIARAALDATK
jgi:hypothetical protein